MTYTSYEVDALMGIIADNAPMLERYKYFTITKEMVISNRRYNNQEKLLNIVGYRARYKTNDDHKLIIEHITEGHFVDYVFAFKSPNGPMTTLHTKMCFKDDWNHPKDEKIK